MGGVTTEQSLEHGSVRQITGRATTPTAIIFDWDNTLVDSWGTIHKALEKTFIAYGLEPWSLDEAKANVRHSARDSFPKLFGDEWEAAKDHYIASFEAIHLDELSALEDAADLIEAAASSMPLAIVSNKTGRLLRAEVEALGWAHHFVAVYGAGDTAKDKPDPLTVQLIRENLSSQQDERVWFVGDADVDMACAQNSNCLGALIHGTSNGHFVNDVVPPGTDLAFLNLSAFHGYLREGGAI